MDLGTALQLKQPFAPAELPRAASQSERAPTRYTIPSSWGLVPPSPTVAPAVVGPARENKAEDPSGVPVPPLFSSAFKYPREVLPSVRPKTTPEPHDDTRVQPPKPSSSTAPRVLPLKVKLEKTLTAAQPARGPGTAVAGPAREHKTELPASNRPVKPSRAAASSVYRSGGDTAAREFPSKVQPHITPSSTVPQELAARVRRYTDTSTRPAGSIPYLPSQGFTTLRILSPSEQKEGRELCLRHFDGTFIFFNRRDIHIPKLGGYEIVVAGEPSYQYQDGSSQCVDLQAYLQAVRLAHRC